MARKMKEEGGGNNAPWLSTFADLMNLLLCFFVLLFSMSTVDAEKFEDLAVSMANSFGVFTAGGASIGKGELISAGMTQLSDLSEYYNTMGQTSQKTGEEIEHLEEQSETESEEIGTNTSQGMTNKDGSKAIDLEKAMDKITEEMKEVTEEMYDQVSDYSEQYNLVDYVELSIDSEFQFVQLTLKGSILYDSGKADIKAEAKPILSKIGDILNKFDGYSIEITGHTDNVPMNSGMFKDNNWLSSARALNAAEYLIDECGIDPATLKYSGRGEYEPINSNASADGRAKNRRIEIKLYNEYSGK